MSKNEGIEMRGKRIFLGDRSKFTLEDIVFHYICATLIVAGTIGVFVNYLIDLPIEAVWASSIIAIFPVFTLYFSLVKGYTHSSKIVFISFSYFIVVVFWFINSGINGVSYLFFMVLLLWQVFLFKGGHWAALTVNLGIYLTLLALNYHYPNIIFVDYETEVNRFIDHGFTYAIGSFSSFLIIKALLKGMDHQKAEVGRRNDELDKVNLELIQSIAELEAVNKTKNQLFSVISHDMRSFSAIIQNFSHLQLEEKENLSEETDDLYKQQIYKASQNLDDLLNNLLAWSKLQMDAIKPTPVKCNVYSMINDTAALYKLFIDNKRLICTLDIDPSHTVFADIEMIQTVVRNIFFNAIKYTNEMGEISISSSVSTDGKSTTLIFQDTGVGVDTLLVNTIMNGDHYVSNRGTKNEKGSGMGFLIVKEFIEANKGEMKIESEKEVGTTVSISLPNA